MAQDASHEGNLGCGDGASRLRAAHGALPRAADGAAGVRGALPADDGGCAARGAVRRSWRSARARRWVVDYEANRVGVTVDVEDYEFDGDGTYRLRILGRDRVALIAASRSEPYPAWEVEPFPDEGGAGTDDVEAAFEALLAYLRASGEQEARPSCRREPVSASFDPGGSDARTAPSAPGAAGGARRRRAAADRSRDLPARGGAPAGAGSQGGRRRLRREPQLVRASGFLGTRPGTVPLRPGRRLCPAGIVSSPRSWPCAFTRNEPTSSGVTPADDRNRTTHRRAAGVRLELVLQLGEHRGRARRRGEVDDQRLEPAAAERVDRPEVGLADLVGADLQSPGRAGRCGRPRARCGRSRSGPGTAS